jgi:hypothetical protein
MVRVRITDLSLWSLPQGLSRPIPFLFNPCWAQNPTLRDLVAHTWDCWIQGSLVYIWEKKMKNLKLAMRNWIRQTSIAKKKEVKYLEDAMEDIREKLERNPISSSILKEEQEVFTKYQKTLKVRRGGLAPKISKSLATA